MDAVWLLSDVQPVTAWCLSELKGKATAFSKKLLTGSRLIWNCLTGPNWSKLQTTIYSALKMENKYHTGQKTLWEKEKLLVTSNFSTSHNVFRSYISSEHQIAVLWGNGFQSMGRWQRKCNLKIEILPGMVENIVGKGENAGYQHFLLFLQCFQKLSFSGLLKVRIKLCGKGVIYLPFTPDLFPSPNWIHL